MRLGRLYGPIARWALRPATPFRASFHTTRSTTPRSKQASCLLAPKRLPKRSRANSRATLTRTDVWPIQPAVHRTFIGRRWGERLSPIVPIGLLLAAATLVPRLVRHPRAPPAAEGSQMPQRPLASRGRRRASSRRCRSPPEAASETRPMGLGKGAPRGSRNDARDVQLAAVRPCG